MDFEFLFSLGKKPRRPQPLSPLNDGSRDIARDLHFMLAYHGSENTFSDFSNAHVVKLNVGANHTVYLNEDDAGTADLVITGVGLVGDLTVESIVKAILSGITA